MPTATEAEIQILAKRGGIKNPYPLKVFKRVLLHLGPLTWARLSPAQRALCLQKLQAKFEDVEVVGQLNELVDTAARLTPWKKVALFGVILGFGALLDTLIETYDADKDTQEE